MTDVMTGRCKNCGGKFYESSPGARDEDLCDLCAPVAETAGEAVALVKELRLAACGLFNLKNDTGDYGYFDAIADRVEALYASPVPAQDDDKLRIAVEGIADDYQTSEDHHPDHVLIPKAKFDEIVAVLKAEGK